MLSAREQTLKEKRSFLKFLKIFIFSPKTEYDYLVSKERLLVEALLLYVFKNFRKYFTKLNLWFPNIYFKDHPNILYIIKKEET